tara:strand:- start:2718 stop:7037 length:4320 start_codon:yes stop_codon:yes gene_type:complete
METYKESNTDTTYETYEEEAVPQNPATNQRDAEAANALGLAANRGEPTEGVVENIKNDSFYDPTYTQEKAGKNRQVFMNDVDRRDIQAPQAKGEAVDVQGVTDKVTAQHERSTGVHGELYDELAQHPQYDDMDDFTKKKLINMGYLQKKANEVSDELGFNFSTAGDILSIASLPDLENIRMNQAANLIGADFGLMDFADYSDFLTGLSGHIGSLPPEESAAAVDTLVENWDTILGGNKVALMWFLEALKGDFNPTIKGVEAGVGTLEQIPIIGYIASTPRRIYKTFNAVRRLVKIGDPKGAAEVVNKAMDGSLASSGVDVEDAAGSVLPLDKVKNISPGSDNSLAQEIVQEQTMIDIHLAQVNKVDTFGIGLTPEAQKAAVDRQIQILKETEQLKEITSVKSNSMGFDITFTTSKGDEVVEHSGVYTLDDQTNFISGGTEGYTEANKYLTSPNFRFIDDRRTMVQMPEQMQSQSAKIKESYNAAINAAFGPLKKKQVDRVNILIGRGDERQEVYTRIQLESGSLGKVYTDEEITSYLGYRQVMDHMYHLEGKTKVAEYLANNISVLQWKGGEVPMKFYPTPKGAAEGFRQTPTESHFIAEVVGDGDVIRHNFNSAADMPDDFLTKKYGEGYELTRAVEGKRLDLGGGDSAIWTLTKKGELNAPTKNPLNYRVGYSPKINKGGNVFVKRKLGEEIMVGGKTVRGAQKTERYFDNYTDAEKWRARQDNADELELLGDREMSISEMGTEYQNIQGGLFNGTRSQEPIPFGLEEQALNAERGSALEGLQRYVNHVADKTPYHLYRMGMRQKWMQSARDLGAIKGNPNVSFEEMVSKIPASHPSSAFLTDAHEQIQLLSKVPTAQEVKAMENATRLTKKVEQMGPVGQRVAAHLYGRGISDSVSGAIRGAAFHTLLGGYNPAQYIIQASGGIIAISINPVHGAKAVGQSMAFQLLDRMVAKNPQHMDEYLDVMKNKLGLDTEGFELWHKSGLKQSVTSANIDFEGLWADLPYDAGAFRRVMANDTFFFKSGELVSARISFATAYNRWKSMNPGKMATDNDLVDIIARSEQYRLNMSKANSAGFQLDSRVNAAAQFQQVNTKFTEKLFGSSEFTKAEKTRMVAGQIALFGAMGTPIVGAITPIFLNMAGINAENLNEEQMTIVRNGAFTWFLKDYMGINSIITGRISLGGGFAYDVFETFTESSSLGLVNLVMGPSYSVGEKIHNAIFRIGDAMGAAWRAQDVEINTAALVGEALVESLAQFSGATKNVMKAYDMTHSEFYKNKDGRPIFEWSTNNAQTIVAQSLGYSPMETQDHYELNNRHGGKIQPSERNKEAKRIVYLMNMYAGADESRSEEAYQMAFGNKGQGELGLNGILSKYGPKDRLHITEQIKNLVKRPKESWEKNVRKMLEEDESKLTSNWSLAHALAMTNPRAAGIVDESKKENK